MNNSPSAAQHGQFGVNMGCNSVEFLHSQSHGLAQFGWPVGAMQVENGFAPRPHHVHVGRPVVIGVDGQSIGAESKDGGHNEL
jgi:hypothetical protein